MPPTAIAPIYDAAPRCPTMATSTSPSSGTVMLLTIAGRAMLSICLFLLSIVICFLLHAQYGQCCRMCRRIMFYIDIYSFRAAKLLKKTLMRNERGIMLFLLYAYAAVGVSELCHAKVVKRLKDVCQRNRPGEVEVNSDRKQTARMERNAYVIP